jgi:hypothetical protein
MGVGSQTRNIAFGVPVAPMTLTHGQSPRGMGILPMISGRGQSLP